MKLQHARLMTAFINNKLLKLHSRTIEAATSFPTVNPQWIIDADKVATGKAVNKKKQNLQRVSKL